MSTTETSGPSITPMQGKKVAYALAATLLTGAAAMMLFSARDNARRETLEAVTEPRAVGDERYFPVTQKIAARQPLAVFAGGRELVGVSADLDDRRDSRMKKNGADDSGKFELYRTMDTGDAAYFFLKVAPGKYVKAVTKRD